MPAKMHADEPDLDEAVVRALLTEQFPRWAHLAVTAVESSGTDNALFRLGTGLVARFPRVGWAVEDVAKEQRWLPLLAPRLPVPIPAPVGLGAPGRGYPWSWSVYRWLDGTNPVVGALAEPRRLAGDLAGFVRALRAIDPAGGPTASRAVQLGTRDAATREAIAAVHDEYDPAALTAAWDTARDAARPSGPPAWLHADLAPGNLLADDNGRLRAVIDFGSACVGDPAVDLMPAWNLLPADVRDGFRAAVGADEDEWARGRGWALSVALIQLPYYRDTNPALAASSRHVIGEVLADHAGRRGPQRRERVRRSSA